MGANRGGATPCFKLVLLGEMAVGKSSLAIRFAGGTFRESQDSTIGAARLSRTLCLDDTTTVRLEIWDTAGQERYHSLANLYYRGAHAAIVAYDITSEASFVRAKRWVEELRAKASPGMAVALSGGKADLADGRAVAARDAQAYADAEGLLFMETSAKTSANVEEIFRAVAERLLALKGSEDQAAGSGHGRVGVDLHEDTPPAKAKCCKT